ncbi:MAG TPA: hypothetical protein PKD91_05220 [Bacteroidia bacterium]|nr:hypothetical protein [Bacteroidia bacterium]
MKNINYNPVFTISIILIFNSISAFAQISPIPKFSYNFMEVNSKSLKINNKSLNNYFNDTLNSDLKSIQSPPDMFDKTNFIKPTNDNISQAIIKIKRESSTSKDTTLFTDDGYTIYIYSSLNKIKAIYYPSINDKKKQDYNLQNKYFWLKQVEYTNKVAQIDTLILKSKTKEEIQSQLAILESNRDELYHDLGIIRSRIDSINDDISFNWESNEFTSPVTYAFYKERNNIAKIFNKYYYGRSDVSVLQSLEIGRSSNNINLNTELANAFFRTFRVSLAANINATDKSDTTKTDENISDYQKLMTNGGQLAMRVQVPLIFYRNSQDDISISLNFLDRFGFDVLPDEQNANKNNVNNYVGGDLSFTLKTEGNIFSFFAYMPFGYSFGNTQFYSNYQFRDYSLLQLQAGVTVQNQFRIKFSGPLYSTQKSLQNVPWTIGFQFTPPSNGK